MDSLGYAKEFDAYVKKLEHEKHKRDLLIEFVADVEKIIFSNGFAPEHEFYYLRSDGVIELYLIAYVCINHFAECGLKIIYLYWCDNELKSFNDDDIGVTVFESKEKAYANVKKKR